MKQGKNENHFEKNEKPEKYEKKDNKEAVPYFTELLLAMGKEE